MKHWGELEQNDVLEEPLPTGTCSRGDGRSHCGIAIAAAPAPDQQVAPVMVPCTGKQDFLTVHNLRV